MSDNLVFTKLRDFIIYTSRHQNLDAKIRQAWRYKHIQEIHIETQRDVLRLAERTAAELSKAIADLPEPTYISRLARQIIDLWDTYRDNLGIYLAERVPDNRMRLQKSREHFETALKNLAEIIKKLQMQ